MTTNLARAIREYLVCTKKYSLKLLMISSLLISILPEETNAMAPFNPFKACIFSEIKIKLTLNGEPAAGAEIIRSIEWKQEWVDTFTADKEGFAILPAKFSNSLTQILPIEFVASQAIDVNYENKTYEVWVYAKRNPNKNSETGKPLNLTCELTDKTRLEEVFGSALLTSCQFN
ncbi:DUF6795 domain-containing protein [Microbulbifer sp. SSSA002]|uniref:DUF6795 domain-containing protein n=1 Tax=unclassified Microbulbifer TaxID=2619833 RepID=UPI00403952C7